MKVKFEGCPVWPVTAPGSLHGQIFHGILMNWQKGAFVRRQVNRSPVHGLNVCWVTVEMTTAVAKVSYNDGAGQIEADS